MHPFIALAIPECWKRINRHKIGPNQALESVTIASFFLRHHIINIRTPTYTLVLMHAVLTTWMNGIRISAIDSDIGEMRNICVLCAAPGEQLACISLCQMSASVPHDINSFVFCKPVFTKIPMLDRFCISAVDDFQSYTPPSKLSRSWHYIAHSIAEVSS